MQKYFIFFLFLVLFSSCRVTNSGNEELNTQMVINKTTPDNDDEKASITFEDKLYKFGTITQGDKVSFTFKFENTGDSPLVLASVKPSCGCTITKDWPKEPIMPGEKSEIAVEFNSNGKMGKQSKSINIVSNTLPSTTVLYLEGEVVLPN